VVALLPLETAYATGRSGGTERTGELQDLIGQTAKIVLYQLPLVAIIAFIMWWTIPLEWQALRGPLTVVLSGFVLAFPLRIMPALLQRLQDLTLLSGMLIVSSTLRTAAT